MSRRSPQGQRASGEAAANHEAIDASATIDDDVPPVPETPRTPQWRTPKFQRMTFNWGSSDERMVIASAHSAVEQALLGRFTSWYQILASIQDVVRTPVMIDGVPKTDDRGNKIWVLHADGYPVEDYDRLTTQQAEHFLGMIVMRHFLWAQEAGKLNGEALFAKARFEERFAIAYNASLGDTVDDRKATGNADAAEERYHAVFLTMLSRRADALVRSAERLQSTLRDRVYGVR